MLPPEDARLAVLDGMPGWKRVFSDKNAVIHQLTGKPLAMRGAATRHADRSGAFRSSAALMKGFPVSAPAISP